MSHGMTNHTQVGSTRRKLAAAVYVYVGCKYELCSAKYRFATDWVGEAAHHPRAESYVEVLWCGEGVPEEMA
jgi:hypothetical protein